MYGDKLPIPRSSRRTLLNRNVKEKCCSAYIERDPSPAMSFYQVIPRWIASGIGNTLSPWWGNRDFSLEIRDISRTENPRPAQWSCPPLLFIYESKWSVRLAKLDNSDNDESAWIFSTMISIISSHNMQLSKKYLDSRLATILIYVTSFQSNVFQMLLDYS